MSKEPPDPRSPKVSKGLCDNCVNREFCSYAKKSEKPMMFCEEYDCYNELIGKYGIVLNPAGDDPTPVDESTPDDE